MRIMLHRSTLNFALLLGALFATQSASAQATVSAQRGAEFAPFAQTILLRPDYGPTSNLGYTLGFDYTRFIRSIVQPSIEFRTIHANGSTVNERSYLGGLKLQTTVHGFRPYATLLVGHGNIDFLHPANNYYSDNALIYSVGGGADFKVTSQWKLRVDMAQQFWNLGPMTLSPMTFGIGASYSIPFHRGQLQ
jgi:opacity protein-like surface antigen